MTFTFEEQANWLVVGPPLWKIWVRRFGWWDSLYIWENKIDGNQTTNQQMIYCTRHWGYDGIMNHQVTKLHQTHALETMQGPELQYSSIFPFIMPSGNQTWQWTIPSNWRVNMGTSSTNDYDKWIPMGTNGGFSQAICTQVFQQFTMKPHQNWP